MVSSRRPRQSIYSLAGWLFADLLLALTIIFLAISAPWVIAAPKQPPPPPTICGMDQNPTVAKLTVSDPYGLRARSTGALNGFANEVRHSALSRKSKNIAGFVEVFGGSSDVGDGVTFAGGAIQSLRILAKSRFIFTSQTAFFKPLWDGTLASNQVVIYVFFFKLSASCTANK